MSTSIMWFRRDLRLGDQPALAAAAADGPDGVVGLYVLDDRLLARSPRQRVDHLAGSLAALAGRTGALHVVHGSPVDEVVRVARHAGASNVHVSADHTPFGRRRDEAVEQALAQHDITLVRTGSAYAVSPGRVTKGDGSPYRVFTPFYRAWREHGWRAPAADVDVPWIDPGGRTHALPQRSAEPLGPEPGEEAALAQWHDWLEGIADYDDIRDLPGVDATSRMSVRLKWGELHPRTLLADLAPLRSGGAEAYRRELGFREFYADVLHHRPHTAWDYDDQRFAALPYSDPGADFEAWQRGETGFPIVDAGMRQLLGEGWMHNRVRMIVASFLTKDLHIEWQHGARHFADHLIDFDLASNQHGWQWVAGCGTDASPYFRVFNPTTQGEKFDPDGTYVRRWVPELRDVPGKKVHQPWKLPTPPAGYPAPIVDHAEERAEALRRYETIR